MEDKQHICDLLRPVLQATSNLSHLVDLEYIPEQIEVIATIGADVKYIDVAGYTGSWMIKRIIDVLVGLEQEEGSDYV